MRKRIGEILMEKGYLTQYFLEKALKMQLESDNCKKIGEIMVQEGIITPEQLAEGLRAQS